MKHHSNADDIKGIGISASARRTDDGGIKIVVRLGDSVIGECDDSCGEYVDTWGAFMIDDKYYDFQVDNDNDECKLSLAVYGLDAYTAEDGGVYLQVNASNWNNMPVPMFNEPSMDVVWGIIAKAMARPRFDYATGEMYSVSVYTEQEPSISHVVTYADNVKMMADVALLVKLSEDFE